MTINERDDLAFVDAETVAFGDRLVASNMFMALFQGGMGLIEEAANYLDGPGRLESKALSRSGTLAYATESMRLTTRLMQIASWLLLHRAVNEGEISKEQAKIDKSKFRLDALSAGEITPAIEELPEGLRDLIARSLRLQDRVLHIDRLLYCGDVADFIESPVNPLLARLEANFGNLS
jgi:regulator of CtrA degradation